MTAALLVSVGGLALGAALRLSGVVASVPTMAEVLGAVPTDPTSSQARMVAGAVRPSATDSEAPGHRVT